MALVIRIKAREGLSPRQLAVKITDLLRKEDLLVVSLYEDPSRMGEQAQRNVQLLMIDADVIVECFDEG